MRKLIALDIDGTLFNSEKTITPKTRAALLRAQERGCTLVLASGRPLVGLEPIAGQLEMQRHGGYLLAYNGCIVARYPGGEELVRNTLSLDGAKRLLRHLEKFPVTPMVDDGMALYAKSADDFNIALECETNYLGLRLVGNVCDAVDFAPPKVLIAAPVEELEPHIDAIMAPFTGEMSFVRSAPVYLEAIPKGVNKGSSLQNLLGRLGYEAADLVAFGDAANDLEMLRLAGVGVAMGNACEQARQAADRQTLSNNEDGIAAALEELGI